MNSDVHPLVATLVILLTGLAIAIWMWGSGEAASIGGPAELRTNPSGHLYLQMQNQLIEHDANGQHVKTHDLGRLGVDPFLGGYAFFSNGDILLRRGPDSRSFGDNFRAFQRKTNLQSLQPSTPDTGLHRCNLDTQTCVLFGETGIDFKAAHGIFVDWQTDDVYISDTTRHLLRKYSADGTALAGPVAGFKFPNQLLMTNSQLAIADTNHHRIQIVDPRTESFGEEISSRDVVPGAATAARQIWPSHIARVGNEWWINNMRTGMNEGGIYIFGDDWRYLRKASLPADADPISLLAFRGEVLVSDWNNDRVYRLSTAGELLGDFESSGLEQVLADSRVTRRQFDMIAYSGVALFALLLGGLIVRAFATSMSSGAVNNAAESTSMTSAPDAPLLLEPDPKVIRKITMGVRLAALMIIAVVVLLGYIIASEENAQIAFRLILPIGALIAIVVLLAWVSRANTGTAISVSGERLTLRDRSGRESSCPVRDVRYDQMAIATKDMAVFLGQPMAAVYDRKLLKEALFPRLSTAQKVSALQMQWLLIQRRHPQGLVTVITIVGLVAYALWKLIPTGS